MDFNIILKEQKRQRVTEEGGATIKTNVLIDYYNCCIMTGKVAASGRFIQDYHDSLESVYLSLENKRFLVIETREKKIICINSDSILSIEKIQK
jgi:hypothetical protein